MIHLCALLMLCLQVSELPVDYHEVRYYQKRIGSKIIPIEWKLDNGVESTLISIEGAEICKSVVNGRLETILWEQADSDSGICIRAARKQNAIRVTGHLNGKKLDKRCRIDAKPWLQATSISLINFILSAETSIEFWMLRPDNLEAVEISVKKIAEETIMIDGDNVATIKVKLQPMGIKGVFFQCHYWFCKQDGVFMRYSGPTGPPGYPDAVVELVRRKIDSRNDATDSGR